MKSSWKVSSNYVCGIVVYEVVRLLDKDATDHSGNREINGAFDNYKDAERVAEALNAKEQ